MIRHILKILWYNRRKYTGVLIEQVLIFIILMVSLVSLFEAISKYREPGLLNTDNVILFGYMLHGGGGGQGMSREEQSEVARCMDVIIEKMRKEPFVEAITESVGLAPYLRSHRYYVEMYGDTVRADGKAVGVIVRFADKAAKKVFNLELEEGTWIIEGTLEDGSYPAIVSRQLMDKLGWHDAMGRKLQMGNTFTVVGIIAGIKQSVFADSPESIIVPKEIVSRYGYNECCAKIKSGFEDEFHACFSREFKRMGLANKAVQTCSSMEDSKIGSMYDTVSSIVMQVVPTSFLLLFAFIGTFGWFWLNSKKRKVEFALRVVVGATRNRLVSLVVLESLILSVMAALPGILLFCFVYEWTAVHVMTVGITFVIMVLFSVFSAWWPAYQVSKVNPVEAMRDE